MTNIGRTKLAEACRHRGASAIAREVHLSEPAIRAHRDGLRSPGVAARQAYEKAIGILSSDWQDVAPRADPSKRRARSTRHNVTEAVGGESVLRETLRSANAALRDPRLGTREASKWLATKLAAIRGLFAHEPPATPTSCPSWPSFRAKVVTWAAMLPRDDRAAFNRTLAEFEAACRPRVGAIDLRAEVNATVATADALLRHREIGDKERVAITNAKIAAGRIFSKLDVKLDDVGSHPYGVTFLREVVPLLMKHERSRTAMLAAVDVADVAP